MARPVKVEQIPNEKEYSETHSFRYVAEVGEILYIKVKNGMRSAGGYVLGRPSEHMLMVPEFPERTPRDADRLFACDVRRAQSAAVFGRDMWSRCASRLAASYQTNSST
jgi:hypothetical protein